jgi:hypothetical protein
VSAIHVDLEAAVQNLDRRVRELERLVGWLSVLLLALALVEAFR